MDRLSALKSIAAQASRGELSFPTNVDATLKLQRVGFRTLGALAASVIVRQLANRITEPGVRAKADALWHPGAHPGRVKRGSEEPYRRAVLSSTHSRCGSVQGSGVNTLSSTTAAAPNGPWTTSLSRSLLIFEENQINYCVFMSVQIDWQRQARRLLQVELARKDIGYKERSRFGEPVRSRH